MLWFKYLKSFSFRDDLAYQIYVLHCRMFTWVTILEYRMVGWMSLLHKDRLYFQLMFLVLTWRTAEWNFLRVAQIFKHWPSITVTNFQNMDSNTLVVMLLFLTFSWIRILRSICIETMKCIVVFVRLFYVQNRTVVINFGISSKRKFLKFISVNPYWICNIGVVFSK